MNQLKTPAFALIMLCFCIAACNKPSGPKEISATFIKDLYAMDFDEASTQATDATKAIILQKKKDLQEKGVLDAERGKRTEASAENNFSTQTLTEKTSGNESDVSNDAVSIHLKLENGKWKVAADEVVVESILFRENYLTAVKAAWDQLKDAYDKRSLVVKDYLSYKANSGGLSKEVQSIADVYKTVTAPAADNASFVRNQDRLTVLLDKNVQPTLTASTDLTMNYIIQLSTARTQIDAAKKTYNEAAAKARSNAYPPVAEK